MGLGEFEGSHCYGALSWLADYGASQAFNSR